MNEEQTIYWIFEFGAFVLFLLETTVTLTLLYILFNYLLRFEKIRNVYLMTFLGYSIRKLSDDEYKNLLEDIKSSRIKVKNKTSA